MLSGPTFRVNPAHPAIKLAVLDGAIDLQHACFAGAALTQTASSSTDARATAHGTHIASVIWGQPDTKVSGLAPRSSGLSIPVFMGEEPHMLRGSQVDLARAILQAVAWGAHVINISGGEPVSDGVAEQALASALRECEESHVLVVAAAGNEGCACLHAPACVPTVLAVGAMDEHEQPLPFSNWGELYQTNGLLAPGVDILGGTLNGETELRSGTSCATAVVSGICAQLLAEQHQSGRTVDPLLIREALLSTARRCDERPACECKRSLAGRISVAAAMHKLKQSETIVQHSEPTVHSCSTPHGGPIPADPLPSTTHPAAPEPTVAPSSCCPGCDAAKSEQLVYALGIVDYEYRSDAGRKAFLQQGLMRPEDAEEFAAFIARHPTHAEAVHWVLKSEDTAIYAITPRGGYSAEAYELLRTFLVQQLKEGVERVSIPGRTEGTVRLSDGQVVPAVVPDIRGMYSWTTSALSGALLAAYEGTTDAPDADSMKSEISGFLDRVYYDLRNLGVTSQERALNFAATNAFQLTHVYASCVRNGMRLDRIETSRSPIGPRGADCWDVKLTFFHPSKQLEVAPIMYRLAVDVSDVIPVTLGKMRSWHVR